MLNVSVCILFLFKVIGPEYNLKNHYVYLYDYVELCVYHPNLLLFLCVLII